LFLLNIFLAEKLQSPIKEVNIMNSELFGKTKFSRKAIFDVYCKDAMGTRFIVEVQVKGQEHFIKRTVILPRFKKTESECEKIMDNIGMKRAVRICSQRDIPLLK